jgi:hypothetical protein
MLTVEVKLNGKTVAEARFVPCGGTVFDAVTITDDYDVQWIEEQGEGLEAVRDADGFLIRRHARGATVWALVAKAAAAILGQKVERIEGKG